MKRWDDEAGLGADSELRKGDGGWLKAGATEECGRKRRDSRRGDWEGQGSGVQKREGKDRPANKRKWQSREVVGRTLYGSRLKGATLSDKAVYLMQ